MSDTANYELSIGKFDKMTGVYLRLNYFMILKKHLISLVLARAILKIKNLVEINQLYL